MKNTNYLLHARFFTKIVMVESSLTMSNCLKLQNSLSFSSSLKFAWYILLLLPSVIKHIHLRQYNIPKKESNVVIGMLEVGQIEKWRTQIYQVLDLDFGP